MANISVNQLNDNSNLDKNDLIPVFNNESGELTKSKIGDVLDLQAGIQKVNNKSGSTITLTTSDIDDSTSNNKYVSPSEKALIGLIKTTEASNEFLNGVGEYVTIQIESTNISGLTTQLNNKIDKISIVHSTGFSSTAIISQSGFTAEINRLDSRFSRIPSLITGGTGNNSVVNIASHNIASGDTSFALGYSSKALGTYAIALGSTNIAAGNSSFAEGNQTIASGSYSHAEGSNSIASGIASHSEGANTISSGLHAHAQNHRTIASGISSHSQNKLTIALGDYTHAGGHGAIASGFTSFNHSFSSFSGATLGANAHYSAILAGTNNHIGADNQRTAIIGGNNIILSGAGYNDTVVVPNLALWNTPIVDSGTSFNALVYNPTNKKVYQQNLATSFLPLEGGILSGDLEVRQTLLFDDIGVKLRGGEIVINNYDLEEENTITIPQKTGTLALVEDFQDHYNTITLSNSPAIDLAPRDAGVKTVLIIKQDGVGGNIVNWSSNFVFPNDDAKIPNPLPNSSTTFMFVSDGTKWQFIAKGYSSGESDFGLIAGTGVTISGGVISLNLHDYPLSRHTNVNLSNKKLTFSGNSALSFYKTHFTTPSGAISTTTTNHLGFENITKDTDNRLSAIYNNSIGFAAEAYADYSEVGANTLQSHFAVTPEFISFTVSNVNGTNGLSSVFIHNAPASYTGNSIIHFPTGKTGTIALLSDLTGSTIDLSNYTTNNTPISFTVLGDEASNTDSALFITPYTIGFNTTKLDDSNTFASFKLENYNQIEMRSEAGNYVTVSRLSDSGIIFESSSDIWASSFSVEDNSIEMSVNDYNYTITDNIKVELANDPKYSTQSNTSFRSYDDFSAKGIAAGFGLDTNEPDEVTLSFESVDGFTHLKASISGDCLISLPAKSGTIALLSDIPTGSTGGITETQVQDLIDEAIDNTTIHFDEKYFAGSGTSISPLTVRYNLSGITLSGVTKFTDKVLVQQAEIFVSADTLNSNRDALYIAPAGNTDRMYLGSAGKRIGNLNLVNVNSIESMPLFNTPDNMRWGGDAGFAIKRGNFITQYNAASNQAHTRHAWHGATTGFTGIDAGSPELMSLYSSTGNLLLGTTTQVPASKFTVHGMWAGNAQGSIPFPRLTETQRTSISGTTAGLFAYQTDAGSEGEGLYLFKSTGWVKVI